MFTNWLTSATAAAATTSPMNAPPPHLITTPPDIVLEVGPTHSARFMAHSVLLAMHSGYLRSAIRLDENGIPSPESPVYLANVTPEQFAPLLAYMYTGYLDLNIENIFGVLLATHVLHMPRALEICRAFLSRTQSEGYLNIFPETTSIKNTTGIKVIRPIASKPPIPNIGFIVPPMPHVSLPSTDTQFRSFINNNQSNIQQPSTASNSPKTSEKITQPTTSSNSKITVQHKDAVVKRSQRPKHLITAEKPKKLQELTESSGDESRKDSEFENNTVLDIASCDGPVRFQRVLNDAYGQLMDHDDDSVEKTVATGKQRSQKSVSFSFHQEMTRNINHQQKQQQQQHHHQHLNGSENDDFKQHKQSSSSSSLSSTAVNPGELYSCVYCKHTFKSQYCYQKHAKRHLNPLSLDIAVAATANGSSDKNEKDSSIDFNDISAKREVRPLDMNVQYYPCKTCGSKFPSYYFVHKHRKMCHSNEENAQ